MTSNDAYRDDASRLLGSRFSSIIAHRELIVLIEVLQNQLAFRHSDIYFAVYLWYEASTIFGIYFVNISNR